ncbi:MAG: cell wall-active antibiotics response protein LiaF [Bacillota bacterium]|uniref:Cell wall-active antibiotics response protein n=1 Tax=Virgibacillus salarius TaxID=447199 RepID=A0A941IAW4_9BACI|nr:MULTISPECIES: cell wall-active antibiotics response protein LiaF [Bacillaceae]NAZ09797.1 hypothetical protein [Agaribacter marinus]MBR7797088.1 cell wall-active antibiotics response protein [Virgibacillus salarius]MCC2250851.1 cell wall-active antibiotics response protein LiaF [Virgibacillus sp. AGTR]MDY7044904.1 cell wall-active antibiotics response protein LiaF [Virgibacillus sp. M23]QRZ16473.1 cell wall-active antibiotics response protein [Virgibacillus sp. AGTR]
MKNMVRYFIAITFIAIGVMLVLANIGVIHFNFSLAWSYIYPIFFIVIGLKWLFDFLKKIGGSWIFGSFFILFGTLLLLDRFEIISFTFGDIFKLWPLLIIYIGFMLVGRKKMKVEYKGDHGDHTSMFSFGSHEFINQNWKVEPMKLSNWAGDFYFDFSKAFIPDKEIPITIHSLAGDVTILMPESVEFKVYASVKAGEVNVIGQTAEGINRSLTYETKAYDTSLRKIDFNIKLKAGSIRIDYV